MVFFFFFLSPSAYLLKLCLECESFCKFSYVYRTTLCHVKNSHHVAHTCCETIIVKNNASIRLLCRMIVSFHNSTLFPSLLMTSLVRTNQ
jgi:hypothetical protein